MSSNIHIMYSEDVLVWDESESWCHHWEWPVWHRRTYYFAPPHTAPDTIRRINPGDVFSALFSHDWEVSSTHMARKGWFFTSESRVWTFRRKIVWVRDVTETSFVGSRKTPSMFQDEGRTWVDD